MSMPEHSFTNKVNVTGQIGICSPEKLHIFNGTSISYGAHQIWYKSWIGRMGGCGPTAASNLLWYLASTRARECGSLFDGDGTKQEDMLRLMNTVWKYITPGFNGVHKSSIFTEGLIRYGVKHGVSLLPQVLEVPDVISSRPDEAELISFLSTAFSSDLPVAFLNLSNGAVRNLDIWHWVTLISTDENLQAEMYDQGERQQLDLALWLKTTKTGGAFVFVKPE